MIGQTVSHYEFIRKLGEGGMGVVYQALDLHLGRTVALKFLQPEVGGSPKKMARFEKEARAISALNHPHIATIYGLEEAGEFKFLVLEYLPAGSLRQKLADLKSGGERLPLPLAIDWTVQIAAGLAHAHKHGIIHRDVKASNVLFTESGDVKIADFGLAKMMDGDAHGLTPSGSAVGTPPCMSPEQAKGCEVDERSDIFSLGIILFELATGQMPFRGSNAVAVMHEIVYTPAPPLNQFRTDAPEDLQRIVSKMLEKDPQARYQTMDDVLRDLSQLRREFESRLPHPDSPDRVRSLRALQETVSITEALTPRRYRAAVIIAVVLVIATAIGIGVPDVRHRVSSWSHVQPVPTEKRIAVLLFTNVGGDPKNEALADGLMEVVSNSLTRLEQFRGSLLVVPAADIRKEDVASARDAWKKVGANLAITGSVERAANHVQVLINLVDTRTVAQLRTEAIKADLSDAALQESVVARVTQMLEPALESGAEQAIRAADSVVAGADRFYVEGLGYLRRYDRPENIDNAIAAFKRSLAIDPNYVLAYVGVAEGYWRRYDAIKDPQSIDAALANASRALSLNDRLAPVHITMGMIQAGTGQWESAETEFKKALKLEPRNADAYRELATTYEAMGRLDRAEATYKKAIELRPDDWWSLKQLGVFYFNKGPYLEAERYFRRVIQLTPDSAKAHSNLGALYQKLGRNAEAYAEFYRSLSIEPTANACNNLGYMYYYDGKYQDAAVQFEKAVELIPTDSKFWGYLADAYRWAGLGYKSARAFRHAIQLAEKEMAINPRDAQLRARLASSWAALAAMESDPAKLREYRGKAESEIAQAAKLAPGDGYVQFRAALVYEQAHQRDRALRAVKSAMEAHYSREEIRKAPPLRDLRNDARFLRLVETGKLTSSK